MTLLEGMASKKDQAIATMAAADRRASSGSGALYLGTDTHFAEPEHLPILTGKVSREGGRMGKPLRFARVAESTPETLPVARRFRSLKQMRLPTAWAIKAPTKEVLQRLTWHGIEFRTVTVSQDATAREFAVTKKRKPKRPYQGHQELLIEGQWLDSKLHKLPTGAIIIPANQRLASLAATLLEPTSEDSLSSWNFFEAATDKFYPVLRLVELQARPRQAKKAGN